MADYAQALSAIDSHWVSHFSTHREIDPDQAREAANYFTRFVGMPEGTTDIVVAKSPIGVDFARDCMLLACRAKAKDRCKVYDRLDYLYRSKGMPGAEIDRLTEVVSRLVDNNEEQRRPYYDFCCRKKNHEGLWMKTRCQAMHDIVSRIGWYDASLLGRSLVFLDQVSHTYRVIFDSELMGLAGLLNLLVSKEKRQAFYHLRQSHVTGFDSTANALDKVFREACVLKLMAPDIRQQDRSFSNQAIKAVHGMFRVSTYWVTLSPATVIMCEQPLFCRFDSQNRLQCEDGPSIQWADGYKVYMHRGIQVPECVVMSPDSFDVELIQSEMNVERQRAMIECITWPLFLKKSNAILLDSQVNELEGTQEALFQVRLNGSRSGRVKILICACPSTTRVYALAVPDATAVCKDAQRFLSGGLNERIISAA